MRDAVPRAIQKLTQYGMGTLRKSFDVIADAAIVTVATLLLLLSLSAFATPRHVPLPGRRPVLPASDSIAPTEAARAAPIAAAPLAENCVASLTACNTVASGQLAPGDCTSDVDGTFLDVWGFDGRRGDIVEVVAWPKSATLTNPALLLVPPKSNASKTPFIGGGPAVEVRYVLSSDGLWGIVAGTQNLFSSGSYVISTSCSADDEPNLPQDCIGQTLVCGQTAAWSLTNQSCRFTDDPNYVYSWFEVYGVAGDFINLDLISGDFRPVFGVYDDTGKEVGSAHSVSTSEVAGGFTVPKDGFYDVIVTSQQQFGVGFFVLKMTCGGSGCLTPVIAEEPRDMSVAYGGQVHLVPNVLTKGPAKYDWYDASFGLPTQVSSSSVLVTPAVTKRQAYYFTVSTPCGDATSRTFSVTPDLRHRAVRH